MQLIPNIKYTFKTNCSIDEARQTLKDNIGTYDEYFWSFASSKRYFGEIEGNQIEIRRRFGKNRTPTVRGQFIQTVSSCEIDIQIKPDKSIKLFGYLFYIALLGFGVYKTIQFPEDATTYFVFFPSVIFSVILTWNSVYQIEKRKSKEFLEQILNQNS